MLVATASLGLIAPIAAQASDVINLEGMNDYNRSKKSSKRFDSNTFVNEVNEELATLKGRVDGLEAQQNDFEAASFSDTTTMDGKAIFTVGSVDTEDGEDAVSYGFDGQVNFAYTYQLNLNTSFNGDDNLYIRLKSGNHPKTGANASKNVYNTYLSAGSAKGDALKVDKIWYTYPVNERNTVYLGPQVENYYMHGTTPSIYKSVLKAFTLGGNAAAYGCLLYTSDAADE